MQLSEQLSYIINKTSSKRALRYIKSTWAHKIKRKRNYETIKEFFNNSSKTDFYIDDITWQDLDMDKVYEKLDRTLSTPGEHILYNILRNPLFDINKLHKRNKIIKLFQKNETARDKIQILLYKLGRTKIDITSVLYNKLEEKPSSKLLCNIVTILFTGLILASIITRNSSFISSLVLLGFVNMFIHYKMDSLIKEQVQSVKYLGYLVNTSNKISNIDAEEINEYTNTLKNLSKNCIQIGKKSSVIGRVEGLDVIGDYINVMFLIQERNFFSIISEIEKHKKELIELYFTLGEIDAMLSIASYREGLTSYVEPTLTNNGKTLEVEDIIHPLLENPISNSINMDNRGIVITGSNMAGKSTFLRTLALNAVFAQTIYTCLAKSYVGSFFNIVTSIEPQDNIIKGKSYYLGEAEALLRVVKASNNDVPCLTMVDEIFRGTNPTERINAAAEIMNYLNKHNALAAIATHDLVLTKMVEGYDCYYFREHVNETGLTFDYSIKEGISPTRNAVRLLKLIGYPNEIIEVIEDRIAKNNEIL